MWTSEAKVYAYLIINFIIGGLAATGNIDGATQDLLMRQATSAVGLSILAVTAWAGVYRVLKHPHTTLTATQTQQVSPDKTTTTNSSVRVTQPLQEIISQNFSQEAPIQQTGLPLSN